jgi:hypothetical protein
MSFAHAQEPSRRVGRSDDAPDPFADELGLRASASGGRAPKLLCLAI